MMSRWTYFTTGRTVIGAGVVIRKRLSDGDRQRDVRYRVRRKCCGEIVELTHRQIAKRVSDGSLVCRACVLKKLKAANRRREDGKDKVRTSIVIKHADFMQNNNWAPQWPAPGA